MNPNPIHALEFDAEHWSLPLDKNLGFVRVPAGEFSMGEAQHVTHIDEFYIARYHTTVAQFRAFVDDSGFVPGNGDCLSGPDDHPVVWVNWYEAMAYCDWLNGKLAEVPAGSPASALASQIASGRLRASLPSEAEWEKAARGDSGYQYPWGNRIDPSLANYKESGVGTTVPVGNYPGNVSPYGVFDMSGNAWNWLRTVWGPSEDEPAYSLPYDANDGREDLSAPADMLRGMRGGAFTVEAERAKSTFRDGVPPDSRDDADGFRIVITQDHNRSTTEGDPE